MEFKVSLFHLSTLSILNADRSRCLVFPLMHPKVTLLILIFTVATTGCSKLVSHRPHDYDSSLFSNPNAKTENIKQQPPEHFGLMGSEEDRRTHYNHRVPGAIKVPPRQPPRLEPLNEIRFPGEFNDNVAQVSDQQILEASNQIRHSFQIGDQNEVSNPKSVQHALLTDDLTTESLAVKPVGAPSRSTSPGVSPANGTKSDELQQGSSWHDGLEIANRSPSEKSRVDQPLSRPSKTELNAVDIKPNTLLIKTAKDIERSTSSGNPTWQSLFSQDSMTEVQSSTLSPQSTRRTAPHANQATAQVDQHEASNQNHLASPEKFDQRSKPVAERISPRERLMWLTLPSFADSQSSFRTNNPRSKPDSSFEKTEIVATTQESINDESRDLQAAGIVVDRQAFDFSDAQTLPQRQRLPAIPQQENYKNQYEAEMSKDNPPRSALSSEFPSVYRTQIDQNNSPSSSVVQPGNSVSTSKFSLDAIPKSFSPSTENLEPSRQIENLDAAGQYFSPDRFIPKGEVQRLSNSSSQVGWKSSTESTGLNQFAPMPTDGPTSTPPTDQITPADDGEIDNPSQGDWKWGMPSHWLPTAKDLFDQTTSMLLVPSGKSFAGKVKTDPQVAPVDYWEPLAKAGPQPSVARIAKNVVAPLRLMNPQFCSEIQGFRNLTATTVDQFQPGEAILVYCEVENFHSQRVRQAVGTVHVTRLVGVCSIVDKSGNIVDRYRFPEIYDVSPKQRENFYVYFPIRFRSLAEGEYYLEIEIKETQINQSQDSAGTTAARDVKVDANENFGSIRSARLEKNVPFFITDQKLRN